MNVRSYFIMRVFRSIISMEVTFIMCSWKLLLVIYRRNLYLWYFYEGDFFFHATLLMYEWRI